MRIAIIKPSALGDICHALPVLSALRGHWPDSRITWIVNKSFEGLLRGHPDLTSTLPFDRGVFGRGWIAAAKSTIAFARLLRQQRFDLTIDLQGLARTGLMTIATGAKRTIGFANAREGARFAYRETVAVRDADKIHAVDRYWRIIEHLGAGHRPKQFVLPVSPERVEWVRDQWSELPRPWVCIAVGAKWLTKRWPPRHFGELLNRMQHEFRGTAIFVGVGEDGAMSREAASTLKGPWLDWCGQTDLPTLAAALSLSDVMLANDTGPLHLASALGTPCIAPYTCTRVTLHGPYGSMNGGVSTTVACAGSYVKKCPNQYRCFEDLTPDRLWPTFQGVLEGVSNGCGGTRTRTSVRTGDFKSPASAIPPHTHDEPTR